jgi:hypothetical protein
LAAQRLEQLADERKVGLLAHARAAGKGGEIRRQPVRERGQHRHAQRLGGLGRDPFGEDRVRRERDVGVLLGGPERQHDPVVALEVGLELHPVQVGDSHVRMMTG